MPAFVPAAGLIIPDFAQPVELRGSKACQPGRTGHIRRMVEPEKEQPVMLPFADKEGTGWHVVVRYHEGHERRIDGFATEQEAMDWIMANANEVDK
jgi:hypothetical protein